MKSIGRVQNLRYFYGKLFIEFCRSWRQLEEGQFDEVVCPVCGLEGESIEHLFIFMCDSVRRLGDFGVRPIWVQILRWEFRRSGVGLMGDAGERRDRGVG